MCRSESFISYISRLERRNVYAIIVVCFILLPLHFVILQPGSAFAQPCGGDGARACCLGEANFGACRAGLAEIPNANSGLCGGFNPLGVQSSGVCMAITPCGGDGERACCWGEATFGACKAGFAEAPQPNSGQCGKSLPGVQSSGVCMAIAPCGGDGERACCWGEATFGACKAGFAEAPQPNSGQCGKSLPGVQSSGVCMAIAPCGGDGERACCLGEATFGACKAGFAEAPQLNSGQCGKSLPGVQSSGVCMAITPCGGDSQRACCTSESAFGACKAGLKEIPSPNSGQCGKSLPGIQSSGNCLRVPITVLLCTFSDSPSPTKEVDYFREIFLAGRKGSLADYWSSVSYGALDLSNAEVHGWYREILSIDEAKAKAGGPNPKRPELVTDCVEAAREDKLAPFNVSEGSVVLVITSPAVDGYGSPDGVLAGELANVSGLSHELGHGIGLDHSYSDDPNYQNVAWSGIGEYDDPWDLMSYANVYYRPGSKFGSGGPGLNAFHVDRMGWIPPDRVLTIEKGANKVEVTLAALNHIETTGILLVRVPFDSQDPNHYLTVEFRKPDGWDAGIPADQVLLHEIKPNSAGLYVSYLLREQMTRDPVTSFNREGVSIRVVQRPNSLNQNQAMVVISRQ